MCQNCWKFIFSAQYWNFVTSIFARVSHAFPCPPCVPWIIKILLTTNLQQKSPCPPCVPWITKISGSPTYKKKRRYSHTTSSAQKNPYLIYFCSCKYTNKTDTIQIFPYIFLFLFVKIKLFLPQATKKNPRNTRRTQILVKDFVQDSS